MKKSILILFQLCIIFVFAKFQVIAQQEFSFKYTIKNKWLKCGTLYRVEDDYKYKIDTIGYTKTDTILLRRKYKVDSTIELALKPNIKRYGTIKLNEDRDSIYIKFWYSKVDVDTPFVNKKGENDTLNIDDDYVFVPSKNHNKWQSTLFNYPCLKLPYREWQLTAITLPFRLGIKDGEKQFGIDNVSISTMKIWGNTRVFKSQFVKSRNSYIGFGVFVGLTQITTSNNKDSFGINFGINSLVSFFNFNIVPALGIACQNGLHEENIYFGIGIGFKLVDIFSPNTEE